MGEGRGEGGASLFAWAIILREHKTARKTGKPRRIPIGTKLGELLTQAIGERQAGPIFLSPTGRAWTVPNLSRTYSRLRDTAGLPRDLVLHLPRHECGTKLCREKGSNTPAGCWGTPTTRRPRGTCTSTIGNLWRCRTWWNSWHFGARKKMGQWVSLIQAASLDSGREA